MYGFKLADYRGIWDNAHGDRVLDVSILSLPLNAPIFTALTIPFFLLIWLLLRWGYETKTISYAFQRKAVLEERILLYFNNDSEKLKDMQELFVAHWMEKSPLEVMLAIAGKRKHGGEAPMDALSGKLEEILKTRVGKGSD